MSTDNQWLNVQDIAEILQIKEETVRRWIRRKDLPVLDLGGPRAGYRIRREDLDHFIWQRYRMRNQQEEDRTFRNEFRGSDERVRALESVQISGTHVPDGRNASIASDGGPSTAMDTEQYLSLLSRVPGITYITSVADDGTASRQITFVSPTFESITGDAVISLRNGSKDWWTVVHPEDVERVQTEVIDSVRAGLRFASEYRIQTSDSKTCWVRDESVPADVGMESPSVWQGVIRDITDQKAIADDLQARVRQHAVIAELGEHALKDIHLNDLFEEAVRYVHSSLNVDYTKILELQPGGESLLLRAGVGWKPGMVNNATVSAGAQSQAGYTLLSNEPVIVSDLLAETRFNGPPLLHDNGVRSGISVIIAGHGKPWGVFGAHTTSLRRFTRDDVNFLQAVANILASAIRNSMQAGQHGRWLSIRDVADSLRVTEETVRRWIRRGELPVVDLGSSRAGYRIHPVDLELFIQERYMQPEQASV